MITAIAIFIAGLALLIKGAGYLVDGASSLAKKFGISPIVIGLTIVAFGTSTPELIVNLFASFRGTTDIAIGNIIGSNIANILLILGISAIVCPLTVKRGTTWKEIPLALLAVVITAIMANDILIDKTSFSALTRTDGLTLIAFFIIFLYYTFGISKVENDHGTHVQVRSNLVSTLMVIVGLAGLTIGGKLMVDSAIDIARTLNVSDALIGFTIVAVGTSLPEFATSVVAAYKKHPDIAVGNIVGSNIFNVFWILGLSATIYPLPFTPAMNFDLLVVVAASLILFLFMFIGKKHIIERWQGGAFVMLYIGYVGYLVVRG